MDKHDKYLGMPTTVGCSNKEYLEFSVSVSGRGLMDGGLHSAGREIMIEAVLQAITSYILGCFLLPKNVTNILESAIRPSF